MAFEFKKCDIEGLYEIQPQIFGDSRGFFLESYTEKSFFDVGLTMKFVQDNFSFSKKNVLRGMHFQTRNQQGKLISVQQGAIYDVAIDIRPDSKTYLEYHGVVLDSERHNQFYIPVGFAHGFLVLSDAALVSYKCSDYYHPEYESGMMWNDPAVGIDWNKYLNGSTPILAEKDKLYAPIK